MSLLDSIGDRKFPLFLDNHSEGNVGPTNCQSTEFCCECPMNPQSNLINVDINDQISVRLTYQQRFVSQLHRTAIDDRSSIGTEKFSNMVRFLRLFSDRTL